jgi:hypothetical protein
MNPSECPVTELPLPIRMCTESDRNVTEMSSPLHSQRTSEYMTNYAPISTKNDFLDMKLLKEYRN